VIAIRIRSLVAFIALAIGLHAASCAGVKSGAGAEKDAAPVGRDAAVSATDARGRADRDAVGQVIGTRSLGDAACATKSQQADRVQLDLYLMLDSSGSMAEPTANGQTKWMAAQAALTTFLQSPQSAGLGVGLQYFPLLQPNLPDQCQTDAMCPGGTCPLERLCNSQTNPTACNTNADCPRGIACVRVGACLDPTGNLTFCFPALPGFSCNNDLGNPCLPLAGYCSNRDLCSQADYAAPAVEIATLPGAAAGMVTSIGRQVPQGLTPTAGALSGAIAHAQVWGRAHPTHRVAVVLATDGFPTECTPSDIPGVAALAAVAAAGMPAISTFVIGVFAPAEQADARTNLDAIAGAGGTGTAFLIDTSQNVTQGFVAALNAIRTMALSCEYQVPVPPADGGVPDYFAVNVQFTSGAGQTVTIGNVPDRGACSASKGGWYYDVDPNTRATPRTINICPTACTQLQADPAGRVDILLGCSTETIVP
jgi:Mg-chelatase subunit ChlD